MPGKLTEISKSISNKGIFFLEDQNNVTRENEIELNTVIGVSKSTWFCINYAPTSQNVFLELVI